MQITGNIKLLNVTYPAQLALNRYYCFYKSIAFINPLNLLFGLHYQTSNIKNVLGYDLCLLSVQRSSDLPPDTVSFLNFPSATENLHIFCKTFTFADPSIGKSKYKTQAKYRVIIERF